MSDRKSSGFYDFLRFPDTPLVAAKVERVVDADTIIVRLCERAMPRSGNLAANSQETTRSSDFSEGLRMSSFETSSRDSSVPFRTYLSSDTRVRVRLIGVNAAESVAPEPERNTEEGRKASAAVRAMLPEGASVWLQCDVSDVDEYGRLLRFVWLELPENPGSVLQIKEKMLNAILIRRGIAEARSYPPDTSLDLLFADLEEG